MSLDLSSFTFVDGAAGAAEPLLANARAEEFAVAVAEANVTTTQADVDSGSMLMTAMLSDSAVAGHQLFMPGLLWAAAKLDAGAAGKEPKKHLEGVEQRVLRFVYDKEADGNPRLVTHDATMAALRTLETHKGLMMMLTGPRSLGKSLILRKFAAGRNAKKSRVVIFDARQYGTELVRGFATELAADRSFWSTMCEAAPPAVASDFAALAASYGLVAAAVPAGAAALVGGVARFMSSPTEEEGLNVLVGAFVAACTKRGEYPVIVIDEANQAMASTDHADARRTLALLQLLVRITKQTREANVVLAKSENGLPRRLRGIGFRSGHISDIIVAQEVPPGAMKQLLVDKWGCGEHLAKKLLQLYGGHVLYASAAVRRLTTALDPSEVKGVAALGTIIGAPATCLSAWLLTAAGVKEEEHEAMRRQVKEALRALVTIGFVPLESEEDKVAEVISLSDVGFVVSCSAVAAGVPREAWDSRTPSGEVPTHVLVPSSHIMRLLIASEVFPPPRTGSPSVAGAAAFAGGKA